MKNRKRDFVVTDGFLLVMEAKKRREEAKEYIWDVKDDSYAFEEES